MHVRSETQDIAVVFLDADKSDGFPLDDQPGNQSSKGSATVASRLGVPRLTDTVQISLPAIPFAMVMQPTMLQPIKDSVPLLLIRGDADTLVNVSLSRNWDATIKGFPMKT